MAIADWFFKRPGRGKDRVDLNLAAVRKWFAYQAPRFEGKSIEPDLVLARLADCYRDARVEPLAPGDFDARATTQTLFGDSGVCIRAWGLDGGGG